jgi:hypothetical protein
MTLPFSSVKRTEYEHSPEHALADGGSRVLFASDSVATQRSLQEEPHIFLLHPSFFN